MFEYKFLYRLTTHEDYVFFENFIKHKKNILISQLLTASTEELVLIKGKLQILTEFENLKDFVKNARQ